VCDSCSHNAYTWIDPCLPFAPLYDTAFIGLQVSCRLEERSSPATFELSELLPGEQYKLATARRLDYEVETGSSAVVVCRDRGRPALTTRVNISVAIVDRNDNAPRFQQSRYELHVAENKPADFVVEQVLDDHNGNTLDIDNNNNNNNNNHLTASCPGQPG